MVRKHLPMQSINSKFTNLSHKKLLKKPHTHNVYDKTYEIYIPAD